MISQWPVYDEKLNDEKAESEMRLIIEAIRAVRNIRTQMNVPNAKKASIIFVTDESKFELIKSADGYLKRLAFANEVMVQSDKAGSSDDAAAAVIDGAEIYIPLAELIDFEKEIARLEKELETIESELKRATSKLANESFVSKAPQKLIDEEKTKVEKYSQMKAVTTERINVLKAK
jgi:valyl-tRNA synthetase